MAAYGRRWAVGCLVTEEGAGEAFAVEAGKPRPKFKAVFEIRRATFEKPSNRLKRGFFRSRIRGVWLLDADKNEMKSNLATHIDVGCFKKAEKTHIINGMAQSNRL